jgi:chemotaxis protein CheX
MDVKIINAVLKNMTKVFADAANVEVQLQKPSITRQLAQGYDILTIIGFNGSFEGNLIYALHRPLTLLIVSQMTNMDYDQVDDLALSAIGELANMVSGHIAVNLETIGKPISITPPSVVVGKEIKVNVDGLILKVPATIHDLAFEVNMVIRE